jgi:hypothetical protein
MLHDSAMKHAYWVFPSFALCVGCGSSDGGQGEGSAGPSNDGGAEVGQGALDASTDERTGSSKDAQVADASPNDAPDARGGMPDASVGGDGGVVVLDAGPWTPSDAGPITTSASWEDVSLPAAVSGQTGVSALALVPDTNTVVATSGMTSFWGPIAVFTSNDDGTTWKTVNTTSLTNLPFWITFAPTASTFFVSGGALSETTNGGTTFAAIGGPATATKNGSAIVSERLAVGLDGMTMVTNIHETRLVYLSKDGGKSWKEIGSTLPSSIDYPAYPLVLDANTYLIGCSYAWDGSWDTGGGTPGIYRTTNAGASWTQVSNSEAVNAPTVTSSRIFWSFQGSNNDGGIAKSDDLGVTWQVATPGTLNPWVTPIVLPDNRIATFDSKGNVVTSADGAPPWTAVGPTNTLPNLRGLSYDVAAKVFLAFSWNTYTGSIQRLKVQ